MESAPAEPCGEDGEGGAFADGGEEGVDAWGGDGEAGVEEIRGHVVDYTGNGGSRFSFLARESQADVLDFLHFSYHPSSFRCHVPHIPHHAQW